MFPDSHTQFDMLIPPDVYAVEARPHLNVDEFGKVRHLLMVKTIGDTEMSTGISVSTDTAYHVKNDLVKYLQDHGFVEQRQILNVYRFEKALPFEAAL